MSSAHAMSRYVGSIERRRMFIASIDFHSEDAIATDAHHEGSGGGGGRFIIAVHKTSSLVRPISHHPRRKLHPCKGMHLPQ